jgi:hypothetical protein
MKSKKLRRLPSPISRKRKIRNTQSANNHRQAVALTKPLGITQAVKHVAAMAELAYTFNPEKAAQAAAFVLRRAGGKTTKGHLVKMLYAADWSQLRQVGEPITGDLPVSMPHGPVLSTVLDLLDGDVKNPFWTGKISVAARDNHNVHLIGEVLSDLLTEREKKTLEKVADHFAHLEWNDVKKECYRIFKEWKNPNGSQNPIRFEDMLMKSGKRSPKFVEKVAARQEEGKLLQAIFA